MGGGWLKDGGGRVALTSIMGKETQLLSPTKDNQMRISCQASQKMTLSLPFNGNFSFTFAYNGSNV